MKVVVDASVAVKWILRSPTEDQVDNALELLKSIEDGRVGAIQPVHWLLEVLGVVARLRPALAEDALEVLAALDLPTADEFPILALAVDQATTLGHHLFDTLYHAVALAEGAVLVTADDAHFRKARHLGQIVQLADWSAPSNRAVEEPR